MASTPPASGSSKGAATPPASRPSSPSPSRSGFRTLARMSTMLRRNSTSTGIPFLNRSSSKSSLRQEHAAPPAEVVSTPSPVAESPAREAAESSEPPPAARPSPLSRATSPPAPAASASAKAPVAAPAQAAPVFTAEPAPLHEEPAPLHEEPAPLHEEPAPLVSSPATLPAALPPAPAPVQAPSAPVAPPAPAPVPQVIPTSPPVAAAPVPPPAAPVVPAPPVPAAYSAPQPFVAPQVSRSSSVASPPPPAPVTAEPVAVRTRSNTVTTEAAGSSIGSPPRVPVTLSRQPSQASARGWQPPVEERRPDYFAWGDPIPVTKKASNASVAVQPTAAEPTLAAAVLPQPGPSQAQAPPPLPYDTAAYAWRDDSLSSSKRSSTSTEVRTIPNDETAAPSPRQAPVALSRPPSQERLPASPPPVTRSLSPKPSKSSIASSYGQVVNVATGSRRVSVSVDPPTADTLRGRSRSRTSIHVSLGEDPYTNPWPNPPASSHMPMPDAFSPSKALSPIYSVDTPMVEQPPSPESLKTVNVVMPEAVHEPVVAHPTQQEPTRHNEPVSMPLPALNEVSAVPAASNTAPPSFPVAKVVREVPSSYSVGQSSSSFADHAPPHETDERLPLLPRGMPVPNVTKARDDARPGNGIPWPAVDRLYQSQGWQQHVLPDSSNYFSHPDMRVTTDIDLRNTKKLDTLTQYLNGKDRNGPVLPPPGWELFLRDAGKHQYDFSPIKSFVNHNDRILTFDSPQLVDVGALSEDDKLDNEYRYWTYMESHPAHAPLPARAHAEAVETLKWCYTDVIMSSAQGPPPPFAPQECQELMNLLKTSSDENSGSPIVHTRIVARVLLRKAEWRQQNFRPDKPLPGKSSSHAQRRPPFRRAVLDVVMAILCLGIPFLFLGRSSSRRLDEEGGVRHQGPVLVIGACACLIVRIILPQRLRIVLTYLLFQAAVILSASVTLLTLPGVDDISRIAGIVAILFSASSMVSAVFALFKYKAELERSVMYVSGEGLMVLSRRSIIMSLPVVFLAWAIAAFVTGITFYSFRGVTLTSRVVIKEPIVDYTHWAVVGGLGGLAGMFFVFTMLSGS